MRSGYRRIGDYIKEVKVRNSELKTEELLGINIDKFFMPSVANVIGTDLSVYKLVKKNQFACNRMHVGRDYRLPVSMSKSETEFMVSPAYDVFEILDTEKLDPEFLMMWFTRREFDRNAWFYTDADVRGGLPWKSFLDMTVPVPSITKQREIVKEYNVVQNRITLNQQMIQKLEETAQAVYKRWFVEEIDLENLPEGWKAGTLSDVLNSKGYIRGPFGSALKVSDMQACGIPVYEQQHAIDNHRNFRYFISEEKQKLLKRFVVQENDFVVSCSGTLGRITEIEKEDPKGIINQALLILRVNKSILHPKIFKYFITSPEGNSLLIQDASGSAQVNIAKREQIVIIPLIIPDYDTQSIIAKQLIAIDYQIKLKSKENHKLSELKDLLLSKLATIEN